MLKNMTLIFQFFPIFSKCLKNTILILLNVYNLKKTNQNLCIKLEKELNIKIIKMRGPFFCNKCDMITTDNVCTHVKDRITISGTKIRDSLKKNKPIDTKFMRPDVINMIRKEEVFIKNEDK